MIWNLWEAGIATIFPDLFNAYLEISIGGTPFWATTEKKKKKNFEKQDRSLYSSKIDLWPQKCDYSNFFLVKIFSAQALILNIVKSSQNLYNCSKCNLEKPIYAFTRCCDNIHCSYCRI